MDTNAIKICTRVRPWHPEKELPYVSQSINQPFFLGDGTFALSPRKPFTGGSLREVVEVMDHRQLDFDKPEPGSETRRGQPGAKRYKNRRYIFDHVFRMDASQEAVFDQTARPLLPGVLDGYNATIFAYGATGCGKTHTISGTLEDPGLTIRIMRELFEMIEATKEEYDTYVELSMVEIYNELIRDLLNDDFPNCPRGGLKLLENEKERVTLDRVTLKKPKSVEEVMEWVLMGNQRRSTSFTESNSESSRSHAVLQINVGRNNKGHEVDFEQNVVRQCTSSATLSIIDLAGSERAAATRNMGARMKEGANINKSLLALSSCISALCQQPTRGMKPHVPYRNSKLTRMLKFSLGGNCRTVMIVCVSPSSKDIEDTHNTLVWADKAKNVSTKISRNTAGNHVSVQQYLITIDQQQQKIRLLEANIQKLEQSGNTGPTGWALKKLELARGDAQAVLDGAKVELETVIPVITEGATQRALWDTAEMRIAAYKRKIGEMEANSEGLSIEEIVREKAFLDSLTLQQDSAYRLNHQVQSSVQQEAKAASAFERLLKTTEERTFGDAFDKNELKGFKLGVAAQRWAMERSISVAREKGYREAAQSQADWFTQAVALVHRLTATLQEEMDLLSGLAQTMGGSEELSSTVERLTRLRSSTDTSLASILGRNSPNSLPLPPPPSAITMAAMSPPSKASLRSTPTKLGPPTRVPSTQPSSVAAFHANPAARRILASAAPPSSPARSVKTASPGKAPALRAFRVGHVKGRTPKKTFRWRDEAGEGKLDDKSTALDALVFSSPSEASVTEVGGSGSDNWDEETSDEVVAPAVIPAVKRIAPRSSLALPLPDWKQNRIMMGKTNAGLATLGEENESGSSPDSKPTSRVMGPPSRITRDPLAERQHNPPSASGSNSSISSLQRPTAASAAKMADLSMSARLGPPSRRLSSIGKAPGALQKTQRRASAIGPYNKSNTDIRRARSSLMPSAANNSILDTSINLPSIDGLPGRSTSSPTALNGPRRIVAPTISGYSPKGEAARRSSLMPPAATSSSIINGTSLKPLPGPRASISVSTLPSRSAFSSLSSRPSISNLKGFPASNSGSNVGIAGAGDVSMTRAAWR